MKLSRYLSDRDMTDEAFAALVGASSHGVRKWRYGERVPRPDQLRRISEVTEGAVQPNDFILDSEGAAA